MSCQACRQACKHPDIKERVALTNAATSEVCGCERYRINDLSPGPVENSEELHFVVADPNGLINGRLNQAYLTPTRFWRSKRSSRRCRRYRVRSDNLSAQGEC